MLRIFFSTIMFILSAKGLEEVERYLDAPKVLSVTAVDPAGLYVQWHVVRQRKADPIIGYKIRIYEIPETSESELKLINAEQYLGLVKTDMPLEKFSINSTYPVTKEVIVAESKLKATIDKIKYNTVYEIRVLAFKRDVDGPLSEPIRIKVLKDAGYHAVVAKTLSECQVSVPGDIGVPNEETRHPYIYNSYF